MTIIDNMKASAEQHGYDMTDNLPKIAKAKEKFFGIKEWQRCPCDGNNPDRYCGSPLCDNDIKTKGICHCHCFIRKD